LGIYVNPDPENFLIWNGIIINHEGIYKGGAFKFQISIPTTYPINPPQVTFKSKVLHTLVDVNTGSLDLEVRANFNSIEKI
jgi:peroxin-4